MVLACFGNVLLILGRISNPSGSRRARERLAGLYLHFWGGARAPTPAGSSWRSWRRAWRDRRATVGSAIVRGSSQQRPTFVPDGSILRASRDISGMMKKILVCIPVNGLTWLLRVNGILSVYLFGHGSFKTPLKLIQGKARMLQLDYSTTLWGVMVFTIEDFVWTTNHRGSPECQSNYICMFKI